MNPNLDLATILANHGKWWRGGTGGARANLRGADLRGADLGGADLGGANLVGANLGGADLRGANLGGANLGGADLRGANLGGAYLGGANLVGAYLGGADLRGAYLPNGVRWELYLAEVVPVLLRAGGQSLANVVTPEVCDCHAWNNCPMHAAFGAKGLDDVPAIYRREADLFIQLFDGKALTYDVLRQACGLPVPTPEPSPKGAA